jgi:hypothetical protein
MNKPKTDRNLEFYRRWQVKGENLYKLLLEYGFGQSRAYAIKRWVEQKKADLV